MQRAFLSTFRVCTTECELPPILKAVNYLLSAHLIPNKLTLKEGNVILKEQSKYRIHPESLKNGWFTSFSMTDRTFGKASASA